MASIEQDHDHERKRYGWFGAGALVATAVIVGMLFVGGFFQGTKAVAEDDIHNITIPRQ